MPDLRSVRFLRSVRSVRSVRTLLVALTLGLLLGPAAGCSDDPPGPADGGVPPGDTGDAGDGSGADARTTCDPDRQTDPCYRCEDQQCCAQVLACENDPACSTLAECLDACGPETATDHACADLCYQKNPGGVALIGARIGCNVTRCSTSCPGDEPPCVACYIDECAAEYTACSAQADCFLLVRCAERCTTDECEAACKTQYPAGATAFDTFVGCTFARCTKVCG